MPQQGSQPSKLTGQPVMGADYTTTPPTLRVIKTDSTGELIISGGGGGAVTQGTQGTVAQSWFFEQTDGTNVLGTGSHPVRTDPTGTTVQPVSLAADGTAGSPAPSTVLEAGGVNPSGNLEPLQLDANSELITSSIGLSLNATNQVSVTSSGVLVIAANTARAGVLITNPSTTATVYYGKSGVSTSTGAILPPGQSVTLPVTSAIYAIVSSTSVTVSYVELV